MTAHEALRQAPMCCIKALHLILCTLLLHYLSIYPSPWPSGRMRARGVVRPDERWSPHHCARRSDANTTSYGTRVV